ncbi:hypothetical protein HMPREF0983_03645 [Erysipelotrichaceae bacterium 3_1_53]|nr:hypothetical protein HMPREF0983_03645 [Erysipelotrichaceae bacterium 3_1_53]
MFALHKSFDQVPKLYDLILSVFDDEARFQDLLECDSYQSFIKKYILHKKETYNESK